MSLVIVDILKDLYSMHKSWINMFHYMAGLILNKQFIYKCSHKEINTSKWQWYENNKDGNTLFRTVCNKVSEEMSKLTLD